MSSVRVRGWEIVNSEGLRSHHTADGMQLLYRRGDEYAGIFAVWDWLCIPGATVLQSEETFRGRDSRGTTSFVGGVSDGEYGVTAMDLIRGSLRARKSWFFFDEEVVCLGSGVGCDAPEPVFTTVNQCFLRGEVTKSYDAGMTAPEGFWWVHHDGIGYVLPSRERSRVRLHAGPQTGSWHTINRSYPDEPDTQDVFRMWIDHGKRPDGDTYTYLVVPDREPARLESYSWPVEILANRPGLQVVRHRKLGLTCLVFYTPGSAELGSPSHAVHVSEPCILLVRERLEDLVLAAASPEHRELELEVELPMPLVGEGAEPSASGGTRVTLRLPGGPLSGSSVVRTFHRRRQDP
jgi:chondroitin AC lyase